MKSAKRQSPSKHPIPYGIKYASKSLPTNKLKISMKINAKICSLFLLTHNIHFEVLPSKHLHLK